MKPKILIVDDEKATRLALSEAFRQSGYVVSNAAFGKAALTMLTENNFDVAILDLEMPGIKGDQVLAVASKFSPDTAFIILTAHASTDSAIVALRSGAMDYLRKPSSLETIISTVERAVTKQTERKRQKEAARTLNQIRKTLLSDTADKETVDEPANMNDIVVAGQIRVDRRQKTASFKEKPLHLTPIEFRILCHLVEHPEAVVSYAELVRFTHEMDMDEGDARSLLRSHIYRLRNKLGNNEDNLLQSRHSRGVILYPE